MAIPSLCLRTLAYNFTLLDSKDYPDLHDFYQKVATADQQQLVLTALRIAKGKLMMRNPALVRFRSSPPARGGLSLFVRAARPRPACSVKSQPVPQWGLDA